MQNTWRRIRPAQWVLVMIAIGGLAFTACQGRDPSPVPSPYTATPRPIVSITAPGISRNTRVPIASIEPTATIAATPTDFFTPEFISYTLNGLVYDSALGTAQAIGSAYIECHFIGADLQKFNRYTQAGIDGLYRLPIRVRPGDGFVIIASAPGYSSSSVRLHGAEIGQYGSQLDFGLVNARSSLPTLPGDLGSVAIKGSVYDAYQGRGRAIAGAEVSIIDLSVVRPQTKIDLVTDANGVFTTTLLMHNTDQIQIIVVASGYLTNTLARRARDLVGSAPLSIALRLE
jgi:hypothetical protein